MKAILVCLLLASPSFAEEKRKIQLPDSLELREKRAELDLDILLMGNTNTWLRNGTLAFLGCPKRKEALVAMMVREPLPATIIIRYVEDVKKCKEERLALSKQIDVELRQLEEKDENDLELWCKKNPDSEFSRYCKVE